MPHAKRILLIEDHDDTRMVMTLLLQGAGFDVAAYGRCKPAEVHLVACDINIAVLDVRMPERCGDDFGKELRTRCPQTMIVFITGEAEIEPLKTAVPDCFVLRKPVQVNTLLKLLDCFHSDTGDASPMDDTVGDQAGPGAM